MQRWFKGIWIPAEIHLDDRLSAIEKILLAEIDSLDVWEDHCFASNDYLSKFCKCWVATVTRAISHLKELWYIKEIWTDWRTRRLASLIKMMRQPNQNDEAVSSKWLPININNNIEDKHIRETPQSNQPQDEVEQVDDEVLFEQFVMHYPKKWSRASVRSAFDKLTDVNKHMVVRDAIIEKWMLFYWLKEFRYMKNPIVFLEEYSYSDVLTLTNVRSIVTPLRHKEQSEEELAVRKKCFHEIGMDIINPIWKSMNKKIWFVFHDE